MPKQPYGKRDPTIDEIIRRHERYIEGLIDCLRTGRDYFQSSDIRTWLMKALADLTIDTRYLFYRETEEKEEHHDAESE